MKKTSNTWNLNNISVCRDILFGVATLWIVLFHSKMDLMPVSGYGIIGKVLFLTLTEFKRIGFIGVDMFLILSGMGLYYSYSKDHSAKSFYGKRMCRILPPYLITAVIWFAIKKPVSLGGFLADVSFVSFITEGTRNFWYIFVILVFYLCYPLLCRLMEKYNWKAFLPLVILSVAVEGLLIVYAPQLHENIGIATGRIPIILISVPLGKMIYSKQNISKKWFVAAWIMVAIELAFMQFKLMWTPVQHPALDTLAYYMGGAFSMAVILLVSSLYTSKHFKPSGKMFVWLGAYSLEIYLIYEKVLDLCKDVFLVKDAIGFAYAVVCFVVTVVLSILLKNVCSAIIPSKKKNGKKA